MQASATPGAPWQGCPLPLAIAAPSSAKGAPGKESWRARPGSTWALIGFGTAPSGPVGRPAHPLSLLSMLLRGSDGISLAILWSLHGCDGATTSVEAKLAAWDTPQNGGLRRRRCRWHLRGGRAGAPQGTSAITIHWAVKASNFGSVPRKRASSGERGHLSTARALRQQFGRIHVPQSR